MAGYGTPSGLSEWLSARGHELPDDAPSPAILIQRAADYLDAVYGSRLIYSQPIEALSSALERATYAAAWHEAGSPGSLSPTATPAGAIKREKVDVLEVEYAAGSGDALKDATPLLLTVEGLLSPFFAAPMPAVFVV